MRINTQISCAELHIIDVDTVPSRRGSTAPLSQVGPAQWLSSREYHVERETKGQLYSGEPDKHYLSQVLQVNIHDKSYW